MKCKSTETPIGWHVHAEAIVNGEGGHARKGGSGVIGQTCGCSGDSNAAATRELADLSELTGLKTFVTSFAGHIASEAAR